MKSLKLLTFVGIDIILIWGEALLIIPNMNFHHGLLNWANQT